jgi:hypothetical protein
MKKLLLLLFTSFILCCCDNDDDTPATNPVDQLPPATQIGANKVGCLLDGVAFLPSNEPNSTNCFYQFVDGGYYFVMAFDKRNIDFVIIGLGIGTQNKQIQEGETYNLTEFADNNAYGGYSYGTFESFTNQINSGELKITKLTSTFVSGTFWYDIIDYQGNLHQIREGRFDMQYTN